MRAPRLGALASSSKTDEMEENHKKEETRGPGRLPEAAGGYAGQGHLNLLSWDAMKKSKLANVFPKVFQFKLETPK